MITDIVKMIIETAIFFGPNDMPRPQPRPEQNIISQNPAPATPAPATINTGEIGEACYAKLRKIGASFTVEKPIQKKNGCQVPYPVKLSSFSKSIKLHAPDLFDCNTALTTARFMQNTAAPLFKSQLHQDLTKVHATGYVCRVRANTKKLSEHAFGRAVDIAAFYFKNGTIIHVGGKDKTSKQGVPTLNALRKSACGPFKTVLGPGSNADHATHFHFDLAQRKNRNYTYCK